MAGTVAKFDALLGESEFLFVVFYRGHWCPFCLQYITNLQKITPEINQAGGKAVIVTSQSETHLPAVLNKTRFSGETMVDSNLELVKTLRERSLLDVAVTQRSGYPHGMTQPAVLVINRENKVLYSWAIVPSLANMGGAKDRPLLNEIWEDVQAIQNGSATGTRSNFTKQSFMTGLKFKIFG